MTWMSIADSGRREELADYITLSRSMTISLSKGFIVKNELRSHKDKEVEFVFEPAKQWRTKSVRPATADSPAGSAASSKATKLALSFTDRPSDDSFKVTYDRRNIGGAKISCTRVFKALNIDPQKYAGRYSYKIRVDHKRRLYVVDLTSNDHNPDYREPVR